MHGDRARPWLLGGLILAAAWIGAACGGVQHADLVIVSADVHTVDTARPRATAIAVSAGRVQAVGDDVEIRTLVGPDTEVIDADGALVVPGFIDGHVHFGSGLDLARGVNLYGVAERERWLEAIAARAAELKPGAWIVGGRWDHTLAGGELPTRFELDAVAPDHPVALSDVDGHALWVNSRALEIAGIDATTVAPTGGEVVLDPASGEPTGILLEAGDLVRGHVPELDDDGRRAALAEVLGLASSYGITGAHDMASPLGRLDDYLQLLESDRLPVRIWFGAYGSLDDVEFMRRRRAEIETRTTAIAGSDGRLRLALGYVKLGIDGVLSTRTAALFEPYADAPGDLGDPSMTAAELDELVAAYNGAGFPVAIHAIGDRGVVMALGAFERSQQLHGVPSPANRVEHVEVLRTRDAGRFARLEVIASMMPHHCVSGIDKYNTARLGPDRAAWSFPWGGLRDAGATLVFGSDWATAPLDPLEHLLAAVTREKPGGGPEGGWYSGHRLTWDEALHAYTLAPAIAAGQQSEIGSLEPGKRADLVLFDRPLPEAIDMRLLDLEVEGTWLDGRRVYPR